MEFQNILMNRCKDIVKNSKRMGFLKYWSLSFLYPYPSVMQKLEKPNGRSLRSLKTGHGPTDGRQTHRRTVVIT